MGEGKVGSTVTGLEAGSRWWFWGKVNSSAGPARRVGAGGILDKAGTLDKGQEREALMLGQGGWHVFLLAKGGNDRGTVQSHVG